MKHKEHDVIIAYAKCAKVQSRLFVGETWEDEENPGFYGWREYRVKTREFEEEAFYVAREVKGSRLVVVKYLASRFFKPISAKYYTEQDFSYIGDKIELEDYVEDDSI